KTERDREGAKSRSWPRRNEEELLSQALFLRVSFAISRLRALLVFAEWIARRIGIRTGLEGVEIGVVQLPEVPSELPEGADLARGLNVGGIDRRRNLIGGDGADQPRATGIAEPRQRLPGG